MIPESFNSQRSEKTGFLAYLQSKEVLAGWLYVTKWRWCYYAPASDIVTREQVKGKLLAKQRWSRSNYPKKILIA
jgi:hypothetical protein